MSEAPLGSSAGPGGRGGVQYFVFEEDEQASGELEGSIECDHHFRASPRAPSVSLLLLSIRKHDRNLRGPGLICLK